MARQGVFRNWALALFVAAAASVQHGLAGEFFFLISVPCFLHPFKKGNRCSIHKSLFNWVGVMGHDLDSFYIKFPHCLYYIIHTDPQTHISTQVSNRKRRRRSKLVRKQFPEDRTVIVFFSQHVSLELFNPYFIFLLFFFWIKVQPPLVLLKKPSVGSRNKRNSDNQLRRLQ